MSRTFVLLAGCLLVLARSGSAQGVTYTGEAVVARVNALGVNVSLQDTGALPSAGGSLSTELAAVSVPNLVDLHLLSANTVGENNQTNSDASVTNVTITAASVKHHSIGAHFERHCNLHSSAVWFVHHRGLESQWSFGESDRRAQSDHSFAAGIFGHQRANQLHRQHAHVHERRPAGERLASEDRRDCGRGDLVFARGSRVPQRSSPVKR